MPETIRRLTLKQPKFKRKLKHDAYYCATVRQARPFSAVDTVDEDSCTMTGPGLVTYNNDDAEVFFSQQDQAFAEQGRQKAASVLHQAMQ